MAEQKTESPQETISRLTAELNQVKTENESLKTKAAEAEKDEQVIREKMIHGLTRQQAISVINRQRAHDQWEKEQAEAAKKAAKAEQKSTAKE